MKRVVSGLVLGCALALMASGCGGDSSSGGTTPTLPPTTPPTSTTTTGGPATSTAQPGASDAPTPALARFYGQSLDWSSCQGKFECAKLMVPLDYDDPGGKTIEINVLEAPATGKRLGAMVVNPGGPGAPGTTYAAESSSAFRSPLTSAYDIVGFDPRGTGDSDPVDCLSDSQLDAFVGIDPDPRTPSEQQKFVDAEKAIGEGCADRSGALAAHISTEESARDMDVLRSALGEAKFTYFGASYGTKLGATYADLFPTKVGRMVLDGALDPSLDFEQLALGQAGGFQTALGAYVQNCVDNEAPCFLGDTQEAALDRIKSFLDSVEASPLQTSDSGRMLEAGNAFYGLILPLYSRSTWTYLDTALQSAFDGDGTSLLRFSDIYAMRNADGTYADNSAEAIYAINCLDDSSSITPAEVPGELPAFEKASPTLGDAFAWGLTNCLYFPKSPHKPHALHAKGAPPIVVVGTTRDPATPYAWAQHLAAQLDSGVLISRDGDGHTGYNSGNDCVDTAVESYLVDGTVPKDGLSC